MYLSSFENLINPPRTPLHLSTTYWYIKSITINSLLIKAKYLDVFDIAHLKMLSYYSHFLHWWYSVCWELSDPLIHPESLSRLNTSTESTRTHQPNWSSPISTCYLHEGIRSIPYSEEAEKLYYSLNGIFRLIYRIYFITEFSYSSFQW